MKSKIIPVLAGLIFFVGLYVIFYKIIPVYNQSAQAAKALSGKIKTERNKEELLKTFSAVNVKQVKAGSHRLSTYLFTFLTFADYLNRNGFKAQLTLKKSVVAAPVSFTVPRAPASPAPMFNAIQLKTSVKPSGRLLYFSNYLNMPGVKKVNMTLKISEIPNLEDYIFIFKVLRDMPVIVKNVEIKNSSNFYSKIDLEIIGRQ